MSDEERLARRVAAARGPAMFVTQGARPRGWGQPWDWLESRDTASVIVHDGRATVLTGDGRGGQASRRLTEIILAGGCGQLRPPPDGRLHVLAGCLPDGEEGVELFGSSRAIGLWLGIEDGAFVVRDRDSEHGGQRWARLGAAWTSAEYPDGSVTRTPGGVTWGMHVGDQRPGALPGATWLKVVGRV